MGVRKAPNGLTEKGLKQGTNGRFVPDIEN